MDNNTGPQLNLVKTGLDKLFTGEAEIAREGQATATNPDVFTQDQAYNAAVVSTVEGGGGYFQVTTNDVPVIPQASINAYANRTTIVSEFNQNMPISRTFMEDQQLSAVKKAVMQRARAWNATRNRAAFTVYNNGFTSQTTIDGVAIYSNSHTNADGQTVDNLETGELTDPNLNILVNSLRTQLGQEGVLIGYEPDFLLTPSILHRTGQAVAKSVLRAGTGNNDLNYWSEMYPGMKVVYSPFLDSSSTTAYFMGSRNHGVMRFDREGFKSELVDWKYNANNQYMYKMISREVVDSIYYNGCVASTGTTS